MGRAHQDARVHPRPRARRPAHEVRAGARGGALPVDGGGAGDRAGRRRPGCGGSPYSGSARVRHRSAQLPRAHGLARRGRDREREALRGHSPAGGGAHHAHAAEPGARGGHAARGPLRRGHARRAPAARRGLVPDLAHRPGGRRAQPGRRRPARLEHESRPRRPASRPDARGANAAPSTTSCWWRRWRRGTSSSGSSAALRAGAPSTTRTPSCCARWRTRRRWG